MKAEEDLRNFAVEHIVRDLLAIRGTDVEDRALGIVDLYIRQYRDALRYAMVPIPDVER